MIDTLALTMQMHCPLEGINVDRCEYRHIVDIDGIATSKNITARCGADVFIPLADNCDTLNVARQWGQPAAPNNLAVRDVGTLGRWPCHECHGVGWLA